MKRFTMIFIFLYGLAITKEVYSQKNEILPITITYDKNSSKSYTLGCPWKEQEKALIWALNEYKRTNKRVEKIRSASDVYKFFKNEKYVDSFFLKQNQIKPEHEILQIVPWGVAKQYFDCRVINIKRDIEDKKWRNGCSKLTTIQDFISLLNTCPTFAFVWYDSYLERYNTDLPGLIQKIQNKSLILYKNYSSAEPSLTENTAQNYKNLLKDKNVQKIIKF